MKDFFGIVLWWLGCMIIIACPILGLAVVLIFIASGGLTGNNRPKFR